MFLLTPCGGAQQKSHDLRENETARKQRGKSIGSYLLPLYLLLVSFAAKAQPATTSMLQDISYPRLDTLVELAKKNYPRIKYYEQVVLTARTNVKRAQMDWFDIFTFTYLYSPNNNNTVLANPSFLNGYQVGFVVNLGDLLQKGLLLKQAKQELKVREYERDEYYVNLAALVRERYFRYLQQLNILKVRADVALDAESNAQAFKHKYELGETTLDEYNKALVNLSDRVQLKIEAEGTMLMAKSALEELVGKKLEEVY
ncbi:MAG: TolC family protein [Chitinophagaceae bacterium]